MSVWVFVALGALVVILIAWRLGADFVLAHVELPSLRDSWLSPRAADGDDARAAVE